MSAPGYHVAHLAVAGSAVEPAELGRVFAASWEQVAHLRLAPGESIRLTLDLEAAADQDLDLFIAELNVDGE
jgi:hypothetical protein